jgi:DNA repair exonuclease SbcCD nuclease subunit
MPNHQRGGSTGFSFVQISDSHIGFNKAANNDVTATLQQAISKINALEHTPDFLIHAGDLSHLSKPTEFDTLDQVLKSANSGQTFFVPGEHDMLSENGQQYLERYGKGTQGAGWFSFDHKGVHFIGPCQRGGSEGRRSRHARCRATELAAKGSRRSLEQHSDGRIRTHSAMECVSREGLGHSRRNDGLVLHEAFRLSDRTERTHSPEYAESRRQCVLSHRDVDSISSA